MNLYGCKRWIGGALVIGSFALSAQIQAAPAVKCPSPISLPAFNASNSVTFGDAVSYSLPLLGLSVQSSSGLIQDCIVVTTGVNGGPATDNASAIIDDPYHNAGGTTTYFRTGDPGNSLDPGGAGQFAGDTGTTWDIQLSALSSFLAGNSMVIYFNHNQEGGGSAQDVFVWTQIALVDLEGKEPNLYFYVTSVPNMTGLTNFGQPGGDPTLYTGPQSAATTTYPTGSDSGIGVFPVGGEGTGTGNGDARFFVRGRGHVCLNALNVPVDCGDPSATGFVNHNLGANDVANAIIFPEIQVILDMTGFGGYDVVQADIRMGCNSATITTSVCPPGSVLNSGYEQIFIGQALRQQVPEPATLWLIAIGLIGIGGTLRRRKLA